MHARGPGEAAIYSETYDSKAANFSRVVSSASALFACTMSRFGALDNSGIATSTI